MKKVLAGVLATALIFTGCTPKTDTVTKPTTLADFEGKKIASITGALFDTLVSEQVKNTEFSFYNSNADEVIALQTGKVFAIALDLPVAKYIVNKFEDIEIFPENVTQDTYGFATRKGDKLCKDATAIMEDLSKSGELDAILEKWYSGKASETQLPEFTDNPDFDGSAGTLRYGTDPVTPPSGYIGEGGTLIGYEIELAARIAHILNMKFEVVQTNFSSLITALEANKVDMIGGSLSIVEERKKSVDFTMPITDGGIVFVIKK